MKPFAIRLLALGTIGLGIGWCALNAAEPTAPIDSKAKAQSAIQALSENLSAADVTERAKKIVKENASEDISSIFRMKQHGGFGIGKLTELGYQNGVERLVVRLGRNTKLTEDEIGLYQEDYLRIAKALQAMAELAPFRANERVEKSANLKKEWMEVATEFKKHTGEFRLAVDQKDPKKLRLAARALNGTCCHCHSLSDF